MVNALSFEHGAVHYLRVWQSRSRRAPAPVHTLEKLPDDYYYLLLLLFSFVVGIGVVAFVVIVDVVVGGFARRKCLQINAHIKSI